MTNSLNDLPLHIPQIQDLNFKNSINNPNDSSSVNTISTEGVVSAPPSLDQIRNNHFSTDVKTDSLPTSYLVINPIANYTGTTNNDIDNISDLSNFIGHKLVHLNNLCCEIFGEN